MCRHAWRASEASEAAARVVALTKFLRVPLSSKDDELPVFGENRSLEKLYMQLSVGEDVENIMTWTTPIPRQISTNIYNRQSLLGA